MAAKTAKKESLKDFMRHKVKNYAEYCDFMRPQNSDVSINSLKFRKAHLHCNKAV